MRTDERIADVARRLVDTAAPITLDEARAAPAVPERIPMRRPALGAVLMAAVVVFVVGGVAWFAISGRDGSSGPTVRAVTTAPPSVRLPDDCTVNVGTAGAGCPMSPKDAEPWLGFRPRTPAYVPADLMAIGGRLRRYVGADPADPGHDIYLYNQAWMVPDPARRDPTTGIQLRERLAGLPGDDATCDASERYLLRDGSIACRPFVTWTKDGVWYSLSGFGDISDDDLVRIADSLH